MASSSNQQESLAEQVKNMRRSLDEYHTQWHTILDWLGTVVRTAMILIALHFILELIAPLLFIEGRWIYQFTDKLLLMGCMAFAVMSYVYTYHLEKRFLRPSSS